jgi:hypothetical protein
MESEMTNEQQNTRRAFARANPEGQFLFSVNDGIPAIDALEMAGCYLASAGAIASNLVLTAEGGRATDGLYGILSLIELGRAALDAGTSAMMEEAAARAADDAEASHEQD